MAIEPGMHFADTRRVYEVIELDREYEDYRGVLHRDGVAHRWAPAHRPDAWAGESVMSLASFRRLKHREAVEARRDRHRGMSEAARRLAESLSGAVEHEVFIAQMQRGRPCVRLLLDPEAFAELMTRLDLDSEGRL